MQHSQQAIEFICRVPFQGFGCSKKLNYLHRPFNQKLLIFQTFFTNIYVKQTIQLLLKTRLSSQTAWVVTNNHLIYSNYDCKNNNV